MSTEITNLKNVIILQAKAFLESADEFYPFGVILKNGEIKPVGVYQENEHPNSSEIFNILENRIIDGIRKGELEMGAIGLDVFINKTKPALQIIIYTINEKISHYHFYTKNGNEYSFEETSI